MASEQTRDRLLSVVSSSELIKVSIKPLLEVNFEVARPQSSAASWRMAWRTSWPTADIGWICRTPCRQELLFGI